MRLGHNRMSVQELESSLPNILTNYACVDLVYLFGSQVTGTAGALSDYDVGVLIDGKELDQLSSGDQIRAQLAHEFAVALGTDRIDVILLHEAPIELQHAVIAQGRLLHQRDLATRVEYEANVMGAYGDYLPVLRAQREDILRGDERGIRVQRYRATLGRTRRALGKITSAR
jgi:predicted nucleotidyltransferase